MTGMHTDEASGPCVPGALLSLRTVQGASVCEVGHLPSSDTEVRNGGSMPLPQCCV